MSDSIISNHRECFICRTLYGLHRHHIFYGNANRSLSEEYGCWVWLCGHHHNLSNNGVHNNKAFDVVLKKYTQEKWEELHGSREKFIETFGKSWL